MIQRRVLPVSMLASNSAMHSGKAKSGSFVVGSRTRVVFARGRDETLHTMVEIEAFKTSRDGIHMLH